MEYYFIDVSVATSMAREARIHFQDATSCGICTKLMRAFYQKVVAIFDMILDLPIMQPLVTL